MLVAAATAQSSNWAFCLGDLAAPPGGVYTHVVRVGDTVYISGQVSRDKDGEVVGGEAVGGVSIGERVGNRGFRLLRGFWQSVEPVRLGCGRLRHSVRPGIR